jgi:hypothetical protein
MTQRRLLLVLPLTFALSACAGDDEPTGEQPDVIGHAPQPQNGIQLVSPKFEIEPASEVFLCMRIPYEGTEPIYVQKSVAYQAKGGHHSMLYYLPSDFEVQEEPHECLGDEMGRDGIRFVGVGTAEGSGIELPPGIVLEIPPGVKLFTQAHYLNTTTEPIIGQDVINLELIDRSQVANIAGSFTQIDMTFEIPAGQELTRSIECTAPVDMKIPFMIPHMHEQGKHFTLEVERAGETLTIYDNDWNAALRDDFPVENFAEHLELSVNDKIVTTCTWQNDLTIPLLFPREMCATFMVFYPSPDGAMLACDESGRHFRP